MIISHKHKYLYIQTPRTASSSMGKELCEQYDGERILWKHARYSDYLASASEDAREYFVFTGQRNPLDALATLYFREKYQKLNRVKADQNNRQSEIDKNLIAKWKYISDRDLSFDQYFNRYHSFMIDRSYMNIQRDNMDFVYRYEDLQKDFSAVLEAIGIEQKRELPWHSKKTQRKSDDFYQYYTPEIQPRVQIVFADSFKEMGYTFPSEWKPPVLGDRLLFYKDQAIKLPLAKVASIFQ